MTEFIKKLFDKIQKEYTDIKSFAKHSNISYSTLMNMIYNDSTPSLKNFKKICATLNWSTDEILGLKIKNKENLTFDEACIIEEIRKANLTEEKLKTVIQVIRGMN